MYEYDDDEGRRSPWRAIIAVAAVVAAAAAGWFLIGPGSSDDDAGGTAGDITVAAEAVAGSSTSSAAGAPPLSSSESQTSDESRDDVAATSTTTAAQTTAAPATAAPTAGAPTTVAPPVAPAAAPYETLPDGSPAPIIATFNVDSITLEGAVPDQAAKDRLQALAIGNAKPGQDATVNNNLTINPAVPRNVGVRIVELTSTRFPTGGTEVLPAHAAELDRVANVMGALPKITALVIGHADQRGNELSNYMISEARALAVKNYIAARGVAPERLSSRAVGEADLLTLNDDAAALELNRRTEFVLYGLLLD